ncbi:MAG TPA: hypothetical protein VFB03_02745 [Candidatus Saccharimonadales bacterium]|nr:hypothetical protein [Candidatus Saccharimonadales bacterium]
MLRQFFRWFKRHILIILLFLIIASVAGYFIYQKVTLEMNRHSFQSAQHAIDGVYADIVSQVGAPDDSGTQKYCNTSPNGYSCIIGKSFIYGIDNESSANSLFKKIQKVIGSQNSQFRTVRHLTTEVKDITITGAPYASASDRYRLYGLDCVANYIFNDRRDPDLTLKDSSKKPFEVAIDCFGVAKRNYY